MANSSSEELAICSTCGTQYDFALFEAVDTCRMCLDERQFVPVTGQVWTNLKEVRTKHENTIELADQHDDRIWSIYTTPTFAIGQRAILIETPAGNVLWDCVANLDEKTIQFINAKGELKAIALSHPHFYTSHLEWAKVFDCPVFCSSEEQQWLNRTDHEGRRVLVEEATREIVPGVTFVKLGGHFPGSAILHWQDQIFCGDTWGFAASAFVRSHHTARHQVFFFHHAQPNFIPLGPSAMLSMWRRLRPFDFQHVHVLFHGRSMHDPGVKGLVLKSMQLQARHEEWEEHELLNEMWEED